MVTVRTQTVHHSFLFLDVYGLKIVPLQRPTVPPGFCSVPETLTPVQLYAMALPLRLPVQLFVMTPLLFRVSVFSFPLQCPWSYVRTRHSPREMCVVGEGPPKPLGSR